MRQVTGLALWVGHAGDLRDPRAILDLDIAAVVECSDSEPPAALPRDLVRLRFPLSDGDENPAWLLRLAARSVAALLDARVPTLVACSAGMSRSLAVAAAGLALAGRHSFAEARAIITADGPADVSPRLAIEMRDQLANLTTDR